MIASKRRYLAGLAAVVCATALSAGAASTSSTSSAGSAAPPSGGWHHGPERMFDKLGLSADQKASVKAIFESNGKQVRDLHGKMRSNMEKLHQTKPDDPNYSTLVSQVAQDNGALTSQAISAQGDMRAKLYAVLTPAQRTQLADMEAKMKERMKKGDWHRGPHGHGPGPGGPGFEDGAGGPPDMPPN